MNLAKDSAYTIGAITAILYTIGISYISGFCDFFKINHIHFSLDFHIILFNAVIITYSYFIKSLIYSFIFFLIAYFIRLSLNFELFQMALLKATSDFPFLETARRRLSERPSAFLFIPFLLCILLIAFVGIIYFRNFGRSIAEEQAILIRDFPSKANFQYIEIEKEPKKLFIIICDQQNCASISPDLKTIYHHQRSKVLKQEINLF